MPRRTAAFLLALIASAFADEYPRPLGGRVGR